MAQQAFLDPSRRIEEDLDRSGDELRYFCFDRALDGIMTVRFTHRGHAQVTLALHPGCKIMINLSYTLIFLRD